MPSYNSVRITLDKKIKCIIEVIDELKKDGGLIVRLENSDYVPRQGKRDVLYQKLKALAKMKPEYFSKSSLPLLEY